MAESYQQQNASAAAYPGQMLESIPVGLLILDRRRIITDMNHQAASLLGAARETLVGRPINDVLPTGYRDIISAISSGQQTSGLKVPELYGCLVHVDRIKGPEGGAVLTIFDSRLWGPLLTDQKTPAPLAPYLHDIVVSSADGISVADSRGYILVANQASADNFGVPRSHIMGQHVDGLVAKGIQDTYVTSDVIKKKRRITKVVLALKTRKRLLMTGTPIFGPGGQVRLVVINERDITDLVEAQKTLDRERQLNEKYQEELNELSLAELHSNKIVAASMEMLTFLRTASKLSRLGVSRLLITGESGTGKGLMAKYIHSCSPRSKEPFIAINCAALPDQLLEAELFGYEKGAFTGADPKGKPGLFELANEGAIFLDEVGEMALPVQAKLLTFLDDQTFMRLGGTKQKKSACTVIAATNQDLQALVSRKMFRQDLYYRLGHFKLHIPPLRERPADLAHLASNHLEDLNREYGYQRRLSPKALQVLYRHKFPGN
ncbi:sigma 54-interacting transcriptional regulator, partial [Deltaproteobacteria bacterium OttesenSCG-928-K17]|nr:sigma 54-interacting transcriptional regulator [Deltaproteobacteria bacterium OttesenSCG-928-K17]